MTVAAPVPAVTAAPTERAATVAVDVSAARRHRAARARGDRARRSCPARSCSSAAATGSSTRRRSATARSCPRAEPMTLDTIFDLASLTKVVATTTSVMMLVEEGRIRLTDRVAVYIPGFERYGKGDITVRHLHDAHVGAAARRRPRRAVDRLRHGDRARDRRGADVAPGERFVYSDINYFLLGDIVRRVSGQPLDRFAHERIFEPLGMKDTMFTAAGVAAARGSRRRRAARRFGWPCEGPGHDDAARRRPRSDRAPDGRRRRARGPLQHRRRSRDLLPHAARRRRVSTARGSCRRCGREDDDAGDARARDERARARLGHRFVVLVQPRRAAAARIVRPHRLHRHVALDRSGDRDVRRLPVEPRPSRRQGRRDAAARPRRDGRRVGARPTCRPTARAPACGPDATSAPSGTIAGAPPSQRRC